MRIHNLRSIADLSEITKGQAFRDLPDTCDYALPQTWLDKFAKWCEANRPEITYRLIMSSTVYWYTVGYEGPVTCCQEVYNSWLAWDKQA